MGAASPATELRGITLVYRRSAEQESALQQLLSAQGDITSPEYHRWLTPGSFGMRFGMADADVAATEIWLEGHGFHVDAVSNSRDRITFSGTAAGVRAAFGTELHRYEAGAEMHVAPASDLRLPADLVPLTAAVLHLSDFRPKPNLKVGTRPQPDYTTLSSQAHYLGPRDLRTMYDMPSASADFTVLLDGSGQRVAVVGQSYVDTRIGSEVDTFQSALSVYRPVYTVLVPGTGVETISPGDQGESEADVEYASGIATGSTVFLVYVGSYQNYSVFDALAYAIDQNIAPVISISYSECETLLSSTDVAGSNAVFAQAAAQGQTLIAASGDSGPTACVPYSISARLTQVQQEALAVNFPASSPYVTGVGGTQMADGTFAAGSSSYWASANGLDAVSSLLSYAPEVAWNEGAKLGEIWAGGGGSSALFARPGWQSGVPGTGAGMYRMVPDIALQASLDDPGFLLCTEDRAFIGQSAVCQTGIVGNGGFTIAGGTSFAAPVFAGMIAVLNQMQGASGQGQINSVLYGLAGDPATASSVFHDIATGTTACVPGVSECGAPGQSGYPAVAGYDEATGLGSVDFAHLAAAWPSSGAVQLTGTITLLSPSISAQTVITPGATEPIAIVVGSVYQRTVTSPTGSVSVAVDGQVLNPALAISASGQYPGSATAAYNFVPPASSGSHLVTATYSGDATHAASSAVLPFLVGNVVASGGLSLAASSLTVSNGGSGSEAVTVTPTGGYTGNVFWSAAVSGSGTATICYSIPVVRVNAPVSAKLTVGVGSACQTPVPAGRWSGVVPAPGSVRSVNGTGLREGRVPEMAVSAAALLVWGLLRFRRRPGLPYLLAMLLLAAVGAGVSGCGGGSGNGSGTPPPPPPPPLTTYTVTLTGTDSVNSGVSGSTTFTLTVQ